jgi:tight adherence protein C
MDAVFVPVALVFVAVFALIAWVGVATARVQQTTAERLATYGRAPQTREDELARPFAERAFAPIILGLGGLARRFTPQGYLEKTERRLIMAGRPGNVDATAFTVYKILLTLGGLFLWFFVQGNLEGATRWIVLILLLVLGFFGPEAWLSRKLGERRLAMQRALPDVLDLLVISVEAGLGFDSALGRVVETVEGPLSDEFGRMLNETRVGVSRREAMRHVMDRSDLDELRSFLLAMLQADAFGVSIARVLRVQADEMRVKRRQRAQEKAFAAPVKLVFPLVFCIFPSLFIILLGPAAIQIVETFGGGGL